MLMPKSPDLNTKLGGGTCPETDASTENTTSTPVGLNLIIPSPASLSSSRAFSSAASAINTPTSSTENSQSPTNSWTGATDASSSPTDGSTSLPDASMSSPNSLTKPTTEVSGDLRPLRKRDNLFRGVDYTYWRVPDGEVRDKPLFDLDLTNLYHQCSFRCFTMASPNFYQPLCKVGDTTLVIQIGPGSTYAPLAVDDESAEYEARFAGPAHPYLGRLVPGSSANPEDLCRTRPRFILHLGNLRLQHGDHVNNLSSATYIAFVSAFPETQSNECPTDEPRPTGLWLMFSGGDGDLDECRWGNDSEDEYSEEEERARYLHHRPVAFDRMFGALPHFQEVGAFDLACVLEDWKDLFRGPVNVETVANTMRKSALCIEPHRKVAVVEDVVNNTPARSHGH